MDGGYNPETLRGSKTAVWVACNRGETGEALCGKEGKLLTDASLLLIEPDCIEIREVRSSTAFLQCCLFKVTLCSATIHMMEDSSKGLI